jgi:hypothetical protein
VSVACPHATVAGNGIVDATDVGIVLYRVEGGAQASLVARNRIVAAGRSAWAALAADPLKDGGRRTYSFAGAVLRDNELWTGSRTHFDIGLAVGTRPWFGTASDRGAGAAFLANTTGALAIRTRAPFAVDGMLHATVRGNALRARPMERTPCPAGRAVSRSDGWGSGRIQGRPADRSLAGCIARQH